MAGSPPIMVQRNIGPFRSMEHLQRFRGAVPERRLSLCCRFGRSPDYLQFLQQGSAPDVLRS
jgi:hypothetical protein